MKIKNRDLVYKYKYSQITGIILLAIGLFTITPFKVFAATQCNDAKRLTCEAACRGNTTLNFNIEFCVSECNRLCRPD